MATLRLNRDALRANVAELDRRTAAHGVAYGVVSKLLCGTEPFLRELLALRPREVMDARVSNLAAVRRIDPDVRTVYIKPPAPGAADDVVQVADASLNSEIATLAALDAAAARHGVRHGVFVMVEMGDLREGVMEDRVQEFVGRALRFDHLRLEGLGANFNCLNGTLPSRDKLARLARLRSRIEERYERTLRWVSGGSSVVLPMLFDGEVPPEVNHLRIGETLYYGRDLVTGRTFDGMRDDVFELEAEVVEVAEKPDRPSGPFGEAPLGAADAASESGPVGATRRALLDAGWLDLEPHLLTPTEPGIEVVGVSSDMTVLDVGRRAAVTRVGERLRFSVGYMGALKLLHSPYVDKEVVGDATPRTVLRPAERGRR
jgi:predicted amino acid racemase